MNQEQINNPLQELVQKLQNAKDKQFTFLLIGRTGVGKSSTVNSLMGREIAEVGELEVTTKVVQEYRSEINGVKFNVVDTPGLCDDIDEDENDTKYLNLMLSQVKEIDSMWFVSRLDETRVTGDEKRGIKLITQAFGADVWKHAVIVFTFADNVKEEKYGYFLEKRTELIRKAIEKHAGAKIADNIPSVAVDNNSETTPDGKKWLGELYTKVFTRMSQNGLTSFFVATAEFIAPQGNISSFEPDYNNQAFKNQQQPKPRIELNEAQKSEIKKTIDASIIPTLTVIGAGIGSAVAPGVGTAVGAALGAIVGLFAWGSDQ